MIEYLCRFGLYLEKIPYSNPLFLKKNLLQHILLFIFFRKQFAKVVALIVPQLLPSQQFWPHTSVRHLLLSS